MPDWEHILGAELYAKAQAVAERDGPEWTVHRLVKEALQQMNEDEALALAVASSSRPAALRAFMAFWLSDDPGEKTPQLPTNTSYGDTEEQLLTQLIGEVCTAESVASAKAESMTLGDWVSYMVSRVQGDSQPEIGPLPPLRGERDFPRYTVDQFASMPCGPRVVFDHLAHFVTEKLERSDYVHLLDYEATMFYEALRHHPLFQREAAVLRQFIEAGRELCALMSTSKDNSASRRIVAPWPVSPEARRESASAKEGQVAA